MVDIVVTSGADDGSPGTLRAALFGANANPGSTITFHAGVTTVTLVKSLPMITADVEIVGSGVTINANHTGRVFFAQSGNVEISNLTIANALAAGGDGGAGTNGGGGG